MNIRFLYLLLVLYSIGVPASASEIESLTLEVVHSLDHSDFPILLSEFENNSTHALAIRRIDPDELKSRLLIYADSGELPDVIIAPSDFLGFRHHLSLTPIEPDWITMPMDDELRATSSIDDKLFGLPILSGNHLLLYSNHDLVATPASSWQELRQQRSSLSKEIALIGWSFMEMFWFVPFVHGFGGTITVEDKPSLNQPAMAEALSFVWTMAQSGVLDTKCNYQCQHKMFLDRKLAYIINGVWAYREYKNAHGDRLRVNSIPTINNRLSRPYFSSIVAFVPKKDVSDKEGDAIKSLFLFMQSTHFQRKIWSVLSDLPAHQHELNFLQELDDPDINAILTALSEAVPMPTTRNMLYIWEAMSMGYRRFGGGSLNANEAANYMQERAERYIDRSQNAP
ncbi:extracellular solute-binding protein [Gilvimarinus sp. SDUM040013]|uniref:Extracellular solute-binding protein n=1 Tax=Gilvimarinus gilvus TaxID=3058038 RepID=A0ABU4S1T3_9GAMM|nr:extracellular solute-binding protein [Gilvimarinus sp. SDUM040013]MDO3385206.1 extracellular solute-binding protein [Gilvimarinus sp. SDUM040013]MDX6849189.1 extracellular solute-binding protein [Gilvimarinus sp. SDUM040013]